MVDKSDEKKRAWPERLRIRDTALHDDKTGARIYTTAGFGYVKTPYVRADLFEALQAERDRLREAVSEWQAARRKCMAEDDTHDDWAALANAESSLAALKVTL